MQETSTREQCPAADVHFTRRTVRDFTGWTDFQVRAHLAQLESLEYVIAHRGARGQLYVYALLYHEERDRRGTTDRASPRFLMGLLDSETLRAYDGEYEGSRMENEHGSSPARAPHVPTSSSATSPDNSPTVRELRVSSARRANLTVPVGDAHVARRTVVTAVGER